MHASHPSGRDTPDGIVRAVAASSAPVMLSVCIPTHHGRRALLSEALESIAISATQAGAEVEVVVSDNASGDGTDEMVAAFAAAHPTLRVVYGRNERDQRLGNILRVVERASGEWCWLFGSDDTMEPEALATVLAAIAAHPAATGIAVDRDNFDFALTERLPADPPGSRPPWRQTTVVRSFAEIEAQLCCQHCYLGTNIVRRTRWLAAASDVGEQAVREFRDWPQLIVLAETARRDPCWVWLPAVLVRHRAGRPYIVEDLGAEPNMVKVHADLIDGQRRAWKRIAAGDRALYRRLITRAYHFMGSPTLVHFLKLSPTHEPGWDARLLRSFTRAFWILPEFWRDELPKLLTPWRLYAWRVRRPQARLAPMPALTAGQCATTVTADLPGRWRIREMLRLPVTVTNRGDTPLRSAGPTHPIHLAARWLDPATGTPVLVGLRATLDGSLEPGASTSLICFVHTPWEPGTYELRITPVQENLRWFDEVDPANGLCLPVRVEAPDLRVAAAAQPSSSM